LAIETLQKSLQTLNSLPWVQLASDHVHIAISI
jgi:hypothetical protein